MALAPKLQAKQTQSLVMTPQLQQAIKLLQLSNIELSAFVEEQLESNPLLERGTGDENRRSEEAPDTGSTDYSEIKLDESTSQAQSNLDAPDHAIDTDAAPGDRPAADVGGSVDWSKAGTGGTFKPSGDYDATSNIAAEKTLREVLQDQLSLSFQHGPDKLIGLEIIEHVDVNGYFRTTPDDIAERLNVEAARVETLLKLIQTFEPTGVGARNLQECLALQLEEKNLLDPAMQTLLDNLVLLAKHDMAKLAKLCGLSRDELDAYIKTIRSLSPKPGLAFGSDVSITVEPDVTISELPQGGWTIELNTDTLPRVLVNNRYYTEVCDRHSDEATRTFMTECHQNANWLVKSLDQRARTVLKVATEIVRQQDGFFAYGIDHMRPLNLKTVADAIDMHESTVSRVTSNKYMATPRGTFEFKYFFTTAIPSLGDQEAFSAEAVRHKIKILISEETATDIRSDDKLVQMLRAQGIDVARRTVAKYRESMNISSSVERRRILKNS